MKKIDLEPPGDEQKLLQFSHGLYQSGIPLPYFIPKTEKNHYYYQNGLSNIIPRLKVKVHSDIENCYNLWEGFTQNESLYDLWDYRYAWYEAYEYKPYFYTIYEDKEPLAMLPLWFNHDSNEYEFFGGWWSEDNTFFVSDERFIDLLYEIIPEKSTLTSIKMSPTLADRKIFSMLQEDAHKSILDTSKFNDMEDYMSILKKKYRYNLKADYKRIADQNPVVTEYENCDPSLFSKIVNLNVKRFSGESYFTNHNVARGYENIMKRADLYSYKIIEVKVGEKIAAVDLIIEFKDNYYMPIGANNIEEFKGIGYYMLYHEVQDAIKNGRKVVDCSQVDYGWKHRYFEQKPYYYLEVK